MAGGGRRPAAGKAEDHPMTERPLTIMLAPESAYGPTNNCIGIGDVLRRRGHRVVFAAEASWRGRLAALGFAEELVDLAPPGRAGRRPRAVLEGIHRADRAGVPQADHRAAGDLDQAGLRRADPRGQVLPAAAGGDRAPGPAGRDRRGQRGLLPGPADRRGAVRAHRVVQPAGDQGPGRPPGVLRLSRRRPVRMAAVSRRVRAGPPAAVGGIQRLGHRGRRPAAAAA